jgi:hypothetical protein
MANEALWMTFRVTELFNVAVLKIAACTSYVMEILCFLLKVMMLKIRCTSKTKVNNLFSGPDTFGDERVQ